MAHSNDQAFSALDFSVLDFSVLVLSGGKSSRMGRDKALLELDGATLLERTVDLGHALGASQVLISRNQPGFIQDRVKDAGPMAGIAAGIEHCNTPWLLVLPVDMPLLTTQALTPLLHWAVAQQRGCFIEGFPLPVLLKNCPELTQRLASTLADQSANRSLNKTWGALDLQQLPMLAPELFQNINDPASFAAIAAQPDRYAPPSTSSPAIHLPATDGSASATAGG